MHQEFIKAVKVENSNLEYKIYKQVDEKEVWFYVTGPYVGGSEYEEWLETLEEAEAEALYVLKSVVSGAADREYSQSLMTERQERGAEAYGTSRLYGY
jgi:hypothetical protein